MSTLIEFAPIVQALAPLVEAVISGIVLGIGGLLFAALAKYTGIAFAPDYKAQLEKSVQDTVLRQVARQENNLSTGKYDIGHPLVATLAQEVIEHIPEIVEKLGYTPEYVQRKVLEEIGRVQTGLKLPK